MDKALVKAVKFSRLTDSVDWSIRQFEKQKRERLEAIKFFVGNHYASNGSEKKQPLNLLKLAVDIHARQLIPRAPRVLVTTRKPEYMPIAANEELSINRVPEEINLVGTLRRWVIESLFSLGVLKVGLHTTGKVLNHEYGEVFVDNITIDDYFLDASAKRREAIQYEGNDYWLPYEDVMNATWIDPERKRDLKHDDYTLTGANGEERAEGVTTNESADLYKEKIWLRDVWLASENLLVTYAVKTKRLLNITELDGPDHSPYYKLGYTDVPGNLLPLPPVQIWRDIHETVNGIMRKLEEQAKAQKTVLGFPGGNEDSVKNFKNAKDGEGIDYHGTKPEKLTAGGIDQVTMAFGLQLRDLFSYLAGNLDSAGGLSPMTDTVGQEKLLSDAAGAQLRGMGEQVVQELKKVFKAIAYYEWNDPVKKRVIEKQIPETDMVIPVEWGKKHRKGKLEDYDIDIDIYSLQEDSPSLKLQRLGLIMERYVLPLIPVIQQQGGTIDAQVLLQLVAKYSDTPEIGKIVQFMEQDNAATGQSEGSKPQHTSRTYEHVSSPGATSGGKSQILQQALLGGRPQNAEVANLVT